MSTNIQDIFDDASGDLAIGDLEAAAEKYRQCTELDPQSFDAWQALGMALMKLGKNKQAIGAGIQATILSPNDQLAWTALSQMYVADQQIANAETAKQNATILGIGGKVDKTQP